MEMRLARAFTDQKIIAEDKLKTEANMLKGRKIRSVQKMREPKIYDSYKNMTSHTMTRNDVELNNTKRAQSVEYQNRNTSINTHSNYNSKISTKRPLTINKIIQIEKSNENADSNVFLTRVQQESDYNPIVSNHFKKRNASEPPPTF